MFSVGGPDGRPRPISLHTFIRRRRGEGGLRLGVPYRIDLGHVRADALDRLVELGAIDAESSKDGRIAALMPDGVMPETIAKALGVDRVSVSPAVGRDDGSVWILSRRPIHIGRLRIVPAHMPEEPGALRLIDAAAFGSGLHPSTALCLEAIEHAATTDLPDSMLDVGTGSGVLALAALLMGVPRAMGIDIDDEALRAAAENARLNALDDRLTLALGGPDTLTGTWPFVVANVLAAPLIEMAPVVVRRVAHRGHLVLSGVHVSLEDEVHQAYRRLGMQRVQVTRRSAWIALTLQASW